MLAFIGGTESIVILFALGLAIFMLLIYTFLPSQVYEGRVVEKKIRKGKGKWVQVIFQNKSGRKKTFLVDRLSSEYIFPGEAGVLKKNATKKLIYISQYSGLKMEVLGSQAQTFRWMQLYLLSMLILLGPYAIYYDNIHDSWEKKVIRPMWKIKKLVPVKGISLGLEEKQHSESYAKMEGTLFQDDLDIKEDFFEKNSPKKESNPTIWIQELKEPHLAENAYHQLSKNQKSSEKMVWKLLCGKDTPFYVRSYAIRLVGDWKLKKSLPFLIVSLESSSDVIYFWSQDSLKKITKMSNLAGDTQEKTIQNWKKWYKFSIKKKK